MQPISQQHLASEWARITIEKWRTALNAKKIGQSSQLYNSFLSNIIINANGDISKIELMFRFYGRFVDMGVGRGTTISQVGDKPSQKARAAQLIAGRTPKKWYSKTKTAEVRKLNELMAQHFAFQGTAVMLEGLAT